MTDQNNEKFDDEFYVAHFPTPAGIKRFYWLVVPLLLVLAAVFAYLVSSQQKMAGEGQWDLTQTQTISGFLSMDPYPVLQVPGSPVQGGQDQGSEPHSVILVQQGKMSADDFAFEVAGNFVSIKGFPIERGGWSMLELTSASDIEVVASPAEFRPPEPVALEQVRLAGEIVDSKCFLGVMKPGSGKVHRACAAMCLAGGMPPMLVVTNPEGERYGYLLVSSSGASLSLQLAELAAIPVSVSGRLEQRGDLIYLYVDPDGIQRLSASDDA